MISEDPLYIIDNSLIEFEFIIPGQDELQKANDEAEKRKKPKSIKSQTDIESRIEIICLNFQNKLIQRENEHADKMNDLQNKMHEKDALIKQLQKKEEYNIELLKKEFQIQMLKEMEKSKQEQFDRERQLLDRERQFLDRERLLFEKEKEIGLYEKANKKVNQVKPSCFSFFKKK